MKGRKCVKLLIGLATLLLAFVLNLTNISFASAFSFGGVGSTASYGATLYGTRYQTMASSGPELIFTPGAELFQSYYITDITTSSSSPTSTRILQANIDLGVNSNNKIPAGSLFAFTLRAYTSSNNEGLSFNAFDPGSGWILLNQHCTNLKTTTINSIQQPMDISCTFWGYTSNDITLSLLLNGTMNFPYATGRVYSTASINYVKLNSESGAAGLTETELNGQFRQWLGDQLGYMYNQRADILDAIDQLAVLLQTQNSSQADVKDAIDDLVEKQEQQQQQEQQDRDDLTEQASDISSDGESAGSQVTNASGNLMNIITTFIGIIANPNRSDCTINADMGHMNLGNIDLCQLSVPPAISTIATVLMIGVIIPVVISIINTLAELLWRFFV